MSRARRTTYPYKLKRHGQIVYIGITKNPALRERQHKKSGKRFRKMDVLFPCSPEKAHKKEQKAIKTYQKNHSGRKPLYNK